MSFSVKTENADVKTAQADNAARMNQVITALAAAGIPKDSMKTTGYTIYPTYQDPPTNPLTSKVQTYDVTNTLQVTLTDISQSGSVIDVAVSNGINQVSSIQFMLSDAQSQMLRSQALKKAVANARADADTVAGALAVNITGTSDLVISRGYMPVVHNYATLAFGAREVAPTPVQPDDITVTAEVEITYTYG
ncbi:MAG: SIMPL domain-containing protein [Methanoregula sp.]|nr:SIMPL domain-containing protein [Methanoregula sp.]